jgi:hypothetical protein
MATNMVKLLGLMSLEMAKQIFFAIGPMVNIKVELPLIGLNQEMQMLNQKV